MKRTENLILKIKYTQNFGNGVRVAVDWTGVDFRPGIEMILFKNQGK